METFKLSFIPCLLITFLGATLLQATFVWQFIVVAGVVGGILAKDFKTAILSGILGFLASWLLFFALIYLQVPISFGLAMSLFAMFFGIGIALILILGAASASIGYFLKKVIEQARSTRKDR